MSIFKVLDSNIQKSNENYSEYLQDKKGDTLIGCQFMFYALTTIFKDKEIDDIEPGIVDAAYRAEKYDFGIDAIYITASGEFIEQPDQLSEYNEDTKFRIHIFQFKRGTGIAQADLLKFGNGIKKAFIDVDISEKDNLYFYNRMLVLDELKTSLFEMFPSDNINVDCHVVFGGLEENIKADDIVAEELPKIVKSLKDNGFNNAQVTITDCQGLINANTRIEEIIDVIEYQKTFKYITEGDVKGKLNGYISIVKGIDIAELVRKHQASIFEANIRDYYKRNDINAKITQTSCDPDEAKIFWSYNNGLTMTCRKVEET